MNEALTNNYLIDQPIRKESPPQYKHKIQPPSTPPKDYSSALPRNKRPTPQTDPRHREDFVSPIMIESPAFIPPDRFNNIDQEMKEFIRRQSLAQKKFISPFDNVRSSDDDDLIVPTCAQEALKQRKMQKNHHNFPNPDLPSFLQSNGSDSDDDLVIPTVAKEYLKKKREEEK